MIRRLGLVLALVFLAAAPAGADTIYEKKEAVDDQIASLTEKVAETRRREAALKAELERVAGEIHALSARVGDVSQRLAPLERELALRELKLNRLNALFQVQTERLRFLRRQYALAQRRLADRLVALYEEDETDAIALLLSARSFTDLLDAIDYSRQIARQDKRIADAVTKARAEVQASRKRTKALRDRVEQEARVVAVRVSQVRELRDRLVADRERLEGARARKKVALESLTRAEREALGEIEALSRVSAELAAKIRAAQGGGTGAPSAPPPGGFVWPVNGPVTSTFGWRWGRMHEGIDIGAATGTPIVAAAAGTVIYSGWLGGYGNLVVVDHGGGLSTAYAHQSQIAVSNGTAVAQGQVVGYVGSTGYSFGPHLHFEVRVNGQAVDPLAYL